MRALAGRDGDPAFRWLQIAAAIGAVVTAVTIWYDEPRPDDAAVLLTLGALPFVLAAALPRLSPYILVSVVVPTGLFALEGGTAQSAVLPAMALVLAVPVLPRRTGIAAATFAGGVYLAIAVAEQDYQWVAVAAGMGAAWAGGVAFGELFDRVQNLHVAGLTATEEAVRAERRRLARELHDLVAHALTGTMLYLTEIRLVLDTDPEVARRALDDAERLARASLADLRGTVRLLSEADDPALEPPIELESDLPQLLDGYRRAGVELTYRASGTPLPLSVASAWCTYRVVQESLTNAARHAPGALVDVEMDWGQNGVMVKIRSGRGDPARAVSPDAPSGDDVRRPGQGILGMSERVRLLGGRFATGPTSSGWMVSAWIPAAPVDMVTTL